MARVKKTVDSADFAFVKRRVANWAAPVVVVAGLVLLLVLAVFLVNREDTSSVAASAEAAMTADNALGVLTVIRQSSVYASGALELDSNDRLLEAIGRCAW